MATIDATKTFNNYPLVRLHKTYEAASLPASDVVTLLEVKKGFRVVRVVLTFDDLGTGTTMDVGDAADADRYIDGVDTAAAAGSSTWSPADSDGYLYTDDGVIQITNLGGSATGSIRLDVDGYFDFS